MKKPGTVVGPIVITMGEPAGISGEILLKAWKMRSDFALWPFFAVDDPDHLKALSISLGLDVPIEIIDNPSDAPQAFRQALPVFRNNLVTTVKMGMPDPANTSSILGSIRKAVAFAKDNSASAIVTNPIHKSALYKGGFTSPGHTEFLGKLTGTTIPPVMMMECPGLRTVPVSIHISLAQAIAGLNTEKIVAKGKACAKALQDDLGIAAPRIAVAGLNPHAGEDGTLGKEDGNIIAPAVEQLQITGIDATGPYPPDTMFQDEFRKNYDLALCMYHDQALIPLKTLNFRQAVNVTLGLPIVRTSPGHGVALEIAGSGQAYADSLVSAIAAANKIATARNLMNRPSGSIFAHS